MPINYRKLTGMASSAPQAPAANRPVVAAPIVVYPQHMHLGGTGGVVRVALPAAGIRPTAGRNIVINSPGLRPGQPGSLITVPLQTLQGLQPGQGIPTGQAGHLLVKTETGQYHILRMGPTVAGGLPTQPVPLTGAALRPTTVVVTQATPMPIAMQQASIARTALPVASVGGVTAAATAGGGGSGAGGAAATAAAGGGAQIGAHMSPGAAKVKCKNFLATLLRLASEQSPAVATSVRNLIQGLIDGTIQPEVFTNKLQKELNSSPQPCLVPFFKKSLPYLQDSLRTGELSIDGVRAPAVSIVPAAGMTPGVRLQQPVTQQQTTVQLRPHNMATLVQQTAVMRPSVPGIAPLRQRQVLCQSPEAMRSSIVSTNQPTPFVRTLSAGLTPSFPVIKEKKSSSGGGGGNGSDSFSTTGDDFNDVAEMGGVNLAEESLRLAMDALMATARSCKDETFLQTGQLHRRIAKLCQDHGLDEPSPDIVALVSHATQERLKTLVEKLAVIAEHRLDVVRLEGDYEPTQDVKGQLRFLADLDRLEKRRHDEAEREMLLRAAKSRTKTEDLEKEKLKAKAREMQRLEEEQLRHEKANNTALMAIGGPKKKARMDDAVAFALGNGPAAAARMRTKRVHLRDLIFLMEQEKYLKRSPFLWKAYTS